MEMYSAIFKGSENYLDLQNALKDIIDKTHYFTSASLHGKLYQIDYYIGGDLQFLHGVCGIDFHASKYSCIWCKCPSDQRYDTTKTWSTVDIKKGKARTVKEIEECSKQGQRVKNTFAICPSIPLTRVVPDTLYPFLHMCNQLINQPINDFMLGDNDTNLTRYTTIHNIKHKHIEGSDQCIKEQGISWSFYEDENT